MRARVKTRDGEDVCRSEGFGEIKEIVINQDFMDPKKVSVSLFFRGRDSSGIIDLSPDEIEMLNREMNSKKEFLKKAKVLKFRK